MRGEFQLKKSLTQNKIKNLIIIDDVGHSAANALKAEFEKDLEYKKFIELIASGTNKIRQTIVAWARPPILRSKGRFQTITKLAVWAQDMLYILDGHNKGIAPKEIAILVKTFAGLIELRPFIEKFIISCSIVEQFLKTMKTMDLIKKIFLNLKLFY